MALKATIFKASLAIADMDRHYYETHNLTIARHPSENDERMMLRLLAFALFADERLTFTKGLSTDNEPELWQIGMDGTIEHWIELGLPSEKRIRQACNKSDRVTLLCYGGRTVDPWWEKMKHQVRRFDNLQVLNIRSEDSAALEKMAHRTMTIHANIQDGEIGFGDHEQTFTIRLENLFDR
ncbi:YaeQ family protein [Terasakiella sp.]|uniref:YaeQ family protein n=1 Tax=Terasakiella sp. TaxID=2034861 RepID=UPI003AA89CD6